MTSLEIIFGIASIFGLLFSLLAWIRAGRASTAAREARDRIVIRSLADEFGLACAKMEQLGDFIEHDRFAEAGIRVHELTSALSEIPYRRSPYLSDNCKNELLNVRTQLRIIAENIMTNRDQPLSADQKQRLIRICRRSIVTLRENLGRIKGEIDSGARK